ncbi:MAG: hypothetical protein DI598_09415, partial [Pseudopedobacter saltans]
MKKIRVVLILVLSLFIFCNIAKANHVKGGWIGYQYIGPGLYSNSSQYKITVYLYIDCHNLNSYRSSVILGVFDAGTNTRMYSENVFAQDSTTLLKTTFSPCLINAPEICYKVLTYSSVVDLPGNQAGYNVNVQFRARVSGIVNIINSVNTGITLFTSIPGKILTNDGEMDLHTNNSPYFNFLDTSTVCHNSKIAIPFSAEDPDGDSLSYYFGNGNDAGGNNSNVLVTPTPPPYLTLNYVAPFSGNFPLGSDVTIDPRSGLISGRAPDQVGEYVVAVYVDEWRKGVKISTSKKELQINVTNCSLQETSLNPSYINCRDYTFNFKNNSQVSSNSIFEWDFGVPEKADNISHSPTPTFVYPDTGIYTLKLKIGVSEECTDSTTSEIRVYPGFVPGFNNDGDCILSATNFNDATTTVSGIVNSWLWDFGDGKTSTQQNPKYQYSSPGTYKAILKVGNSKGCSDTISHQLDIISQVELNPLFTDTLICYKDSVLLIVNSSNAKTYHWTSSDNNIPDADTNSILVFPKTNTEYTITAHSGDCVESKKIQVNLLQNLNIIANDVYACIGDTATFNVSTQATNFLWSQQTGVDTLNNSTIIQPSILVSGSNSYSILAKYGSNCQVEKTVQVYAAKYPTIQIQENPDTTICLGNSLTITTTGTTTDNIWNPSNQRNSSIIVKPNNTTSYIIDGYDKNSYCTKHVQDTIIVRIAPHFSIKLTNDTTVVWNQPLSLIPTTNFTDRKYYYSWTPFSYLSSTDSATTIATIPYGVGQQFYTLNMSDEFGCVAAAKIAAHIFQTQTGFFVPSAFSPNGDGKN